MLKRSKRTLSVLFMVAVLVLALPAAAGAKPPRLVDEVGLLSPLEATQLEVRLDSISELHSFDTVVVVIPSLDHREARVYAADYLEDNGYGYGPSLDSIILLLATEDRDYGFATFGFGIQVFSELVQDRLEDAFLPYLRNDRYAEAFMAFADVVDQYLTSAEAGDFYDYDNIPVTEEDVSRRRTTAVGVSIGGALLLALIVAQSQKAQLKSVRQKTAADEYVRSGSMLLTGQQDIFLYRHVNKVKRQTESSRSGGSSSSFSSSSGRSSSGRSGKY